MALFAEGAIRSKQSAIVLDYHDLRQVVAAID
jgi:hypothetical protein